MPLGYRIVVSSENSIYLAWQTFVFCHSAISRVGQHPTVIVHSDGDALLPEFILLRRLGCPIIEAPSYRNHPTGQYPPRNELGSLLVASSIQDLSEKTIMLCEPDMLFRAAPECPALLAGQAYSYMNYGEPRIRSVLNYYGIPDSDSVLNVNYRIGVPYFIPVCQLRRISTRWLEVLDSFSEISWIDIMYAFGIALFLEGLEISTFDRMCHNLISSSIPSGDIIHYCYGDSLWSKRHYVESSPFDSVGCEDYQCASNSVLGEIEMQIHEAAELFASSSHIS